MTFKQAIDLGGHVRKGEHGSLWVYADGFRRSETNDNGEEVERQTPFLKAYTVFNVDQIDGLPERFHAKAERKLTEPSQRAENAEAFVANTGAVIRHGSNRAFYSRASDHIQMPPREAFKEAEPYYQTILHE